MLQTGFFQDDHLQMISKMDSGFFLGGETLPSLSLWGNGPLKDPSLECWLQDGARVIKHTSLSAKNERWTKTEALYWASGPESVLLRQSRSDAENVV